MKSFDDKFEVLKTILIFTIVACLVTGLMVLIWLYGCQPGAVQGAESTKYFNAKMIEVSKKKIRSRRPAKRRPNTKQETVLLTSVPTFNPTVYHQYWIPSMVLDPIGATAQNGGSSLPMVANPVTKEKNPVTDEKTPVPVEKVATSTSDQRERCANSDPERIRLQKLPNAPVKFKSKAVWK